MSPAENSPSPGSALRAERSARTDFATLRPWLAGLAFFVAAMLLWPQLQGIPARSELSVVSGAITEVRMGLKPQRVLFRVQSSPLLFQPRLSLVADPEKTLAPGQVVTVGHANGTASVLERSVDVVLLSVRGHECYGPELLAEKLRRDRVLTFAAAGGLLLLGGGLAFAHFKTRHAGSGRRAKGRGSPY